MSSQGVEESESHEQLWEAVPPVRSADPVTSLTEIVKGWKRAGCSKESAERRLTAFLDDVMINGVVDQDDPVRDVLDFVTGYCSIQMKIFP
jgi:hypothetical protein